MFKEIKNIITTCEKEHQLIEIYSNQIDSSIEHSVKWCSICGTVVVDVVVDGNRTYAGRVRKMQLPLITSTLTLKE